jgi:hypothetical protein
MNRFLPIPVITTKLLEGNMSFDIIVTVILENWLNLSTDDKNSQFCKLKVQIVAEQSIMLKTSS